MSKTFYEIKDLCLIKGGKRIPKGDTLQKEENSHPYIRIVDMYQGKYVNKNSEILYARNSYFPKIKNYTVNSGDVILAIVGNTLGIASIVGDSLDGANLTENCCKFIDIDRNKVLPEFLYYSLTAPLNQNVIQKFKVGSSQPKLPLYNIERLKVSNIDVNEQTKIVDVLASIDKKIAINNRINDNLQQLVENIYDHYFMQQSTDENFAENYQRIYCKDLLEVKTGKQDANFGCNNGKYKFFTCSKETLRCDVPAFSGHSILIAGNGDFNVKHYSGEFNAYQRTYVLIPNDELFYGTLYMASLKLVNKFKKASAGSIVKFISKSDVENIEIIVPKDRTLLLQLNEHLYAIEKHQEEIEKLESLREFLLPMLMNGQISIA